MIGDSGICAVHFFPRRLSFRFPVGPMVWGLRAGTSRWALEFRTAPNVLNHVLNNVGSARVQLAVGISARTNRDYDRTEAEDAHLTLVASSHTVCQTR
jgi:hypothetical protein